MTAPGPSALSPLDPGLLDGVETSGTRWLLLEQPGPWRGPDEIAGSELDPALAAELRARAAEAGMRLLLIRRSARRYRPQVRACLVVSGARGRPQMRRHLLGRPRDALSIDLGEGPGGEATEWSQPLYAVTARPPGARERWSGRREQPLLAALRARRPEGAWEVSHLDGERLVGALTVFPHGLMYARVGPAAAPAVIAAHERGELALGWLRGRAGDPWEVQVAEHLVRRSTGRARIEDVVPIGRRRHGHDEATVSLRLDGAGIVEVRVRRVPAGLDGRPVCSGAGGAVARYELVSMRVAPEGRAIL